MSEHSNLYDVIVIGGGPAGLTAAIYLARARYRVLVLEKEKFGGQITITSEVVNYPGVFKTNGTELTETMRKQAEAFGAEFLLSDAEKIDMSSDIAKVTTSRGTLECFGVLLATGAHPRMVGFKGEEEYKGRGVAYCATCDGEFFTGKDVFVIGGGFAAAEESVFLTKYARHVTILMRSEDFTCAEATAEEAKKNDKITIINNTEVVEVSGEGALNHIVYRDIKSGKETVFNSKEGETFGVFVFAGYVPATDLVKDLCTLDRGYVVTDRSQKTSRDGLYAAGDVCIKPLRQVVTAVGDGALAATELEKYCSLMQQKTGKHPIQPKLKKVEEKQEEKAEKSDGLFDSEMRAQLETLFAKMASPLTLSLSLDDREVSKELEAYMHELSLISDKIKVVKGDDEADKPVVRVLKDGLWTGLAFHGAPGGHEFTSFVLGLYNAAGPGQALSDEVKAEIESIKQPIHLKILVSLTCTMCPELVTAAQRIAAASPLVTAEVFDINHFASLKEKYNVMSVPCMIVNDKDVTFGKKNIPQLLSYLKSLN